MALDTLQAYRGQTVIYVGEASVDGTLADGSSATMQTAGPKFVSALKQNWEQISLMPLPGWPSAPACLSVWSRKEAVLVEGFVEDPTDSNCHMSWEAEAGDSCRLRKDVMKMYDALWKEAVFAYCLNKGRLGRLSENEKWLLIQCLLTKGGATSKLLSPIARLLGVVS